MRLDDLGAELDRYFRVDLVGDDDWSRAFDHAYGGAAWWRALLEPGFAGRWAGFAVRGADEVDQAVTCVFPSDDLIERLEPRTLLFSEHPLDFGDRSGFRPLARESLETLRERGCSFYVVHVPLYQHPEIGPSRLLAEGLGLEGVETFLQLDSAVPGGAAAVGESSLTVDGLSHRIRAFLGPAIPIHVLTRTAELAGRVAVVAGAGARVEYLSAALERDCTTYVTGNAATNSEVEPVQERVRRFRALADAEHVSLIDATHYGTERPPQLAMVEWFRRLGLPAWFAENGPK